MRMIFLLLATIVIGGCINRDEHGYVSGYEIILRGFTSDEVQQLESHLEARLGYHTHRYQYDSQRRAEVGHETTQKSAELNRDLRETLVNLELSARVQFSEKGFQVQKIPHQGTLQPKDSDYQW